MVTIASSISLSSFFSCARAAAPREERASESHTTIQSGMCSAVLRGAAHAMQRRGCRFRSQSVRPGWQAWMADGGWDRMALHIVVVAVAAFKITAALRDIQKVWAVRSMPRCLASSFADASAAPRKIICSLHFSPSRKSRKHNLRVKKLKNQFKQSWDN